MDDELKALNRKRGSIKHKLTSFIKFLQPIKETFNTEFKLSDESLSKLRLRLENIEKDFQDYDEVQSQIELMCNDEQLELQYEERDEFVALYADHVAVSQMIIEKCTNNYNSNSDQQSVVSDNLQVLSEHGSNAMGNIRLPTINLPKFNGNYNVWLEFKDTFESLIHTNNSITNIQKYHYLRASLEDEAIKVIQSLEFSANNYTTAWDLLCNRYNNKRLLVHNHIKALFLLQNLTKESSNGLRNLLDNVSKHIRALNNLDQKTDNWDSILIFLISSKFDKITAREWEQHKCKDEFPKLTELYGFLRSRANLLETLEFSTGEPIKHHSAKKLSFVSTNIKCNYCKNSHMIYTCPTFKNLNIAERWDKAKQLNLCTNCLCTGHHVKKCRSGNCKQCGKKHSSLLHQPSLPTQQSTANHSSSDAQSEIALSSYNQSLRCVLLATAEVYVSDSFGKNHICCGILDSGSQSNFITQNLADKLGLVGTAANIMVSGVNNSNTLVTKKCEITVHSKFSDFSKSMQCLIIPRITGDMPDNKIDLTNWNIPKDVPLADPIFFKRKQIDLLFGAGIFWTLIEQHKIYLGKTLPVLQNTKLGYIFTGQVNSPTNTTTCNFQVSSTLDDELQKFWKIEECQTKQLVSDDDLQCEIIFEKTVKRNSDGRFIVKLPLKESPAVLGDSKTLATKCFLSLERKFESNAELKCEYTKFINEYIQLNHMTLLNESDEYLSNYYLPHHAVLRTDSLTTKLRVVFNGSAVTSTGKSLNDIQFTGPSIQNELLNILLRFRQHNVVVCSDIEKMYRQILVQDNDRNLQRIIWRDKPTKPLQSYALTTVTYGTRSAPYLAIKCVKELAKEFKSSYPNSSERIRRDFYVDDLITGFPNEIEAITACKEISAIMNTACFSLRKWVSNSSQVLSNLQKDNDPMGVLNLGAHECMKTLGIQWISYSDLLTYMISTDQDVPHSKRHILSVISKLFDPLGLVSPCTVLAKIIIQKLWVLKLDWDDPIPDDLRYKWQYFYNNLSYLNQLKIPRHAVLPQYDNLELHGFCDSSQEAYAACVYLRSSYLNEVNVTLLCAKTKVAPLKAMTIPRLELCGALILAKLVKVVTDSLTITPKCFLWSDSTVILHWIHTEPNKLQTFVGNRVNEINKLTSAYTWNHVGSKENPADLASRGLNPVELLNSERWWKGPSWLQEFNANTHVTKFVPSITPPEMKKQFTCLHNTSNENINLFTRYSSFVKLQRITAYCLRFYQNLRTKKENRQIGVLTHTELTSALKQLIKLCQTESFTEEINAIKNNKELHSKNKLRNLAPFLDSNDVLRVGGRLKYSHLTFDSKHPILIHGKHPFTKLLFRHEHNRLLHAGPQLLLASIRQNYWPIAGMNVSKYTVRVCIKCFKFKPKTASTIMGDLPEQRVTKMTPFYVTGVDYGGPFLIKDRKGRGSKTSKAYICLFVCFSVKAIHIELVTDLTSESFIAALRRFVSRRGLPSQIWSDNATNFVGASNSLKELHQFLLRSNDEILNQCASMNIEWHFIPPSSPHFGGLWEAGMKSVKNHLLKVIGETKLTYEELLTVLVQIEGILNSRPLYPISSDPSDPMPLTPSHFLIGKPLVAVPSPNVLDLSTNRLTRYQLIQQCTQSFWKRWSTEYLSYLQTRNKWNKPTTPLQVGTLVLVHNDNLPPCQWLMGRIIQLHPGKDNAVRVVTVQTTRGTYRRAITKICPLPLPEKDDLHLEEH